MNDNVNKPLHYTNQQIECIDYIRYTSTDEEFIGFCLGNVKKYIHRWKDKNGLEDLQKAAWYLHKATEVMVNK
jgi:hypothetical protein